MKRRNQHAALHRAVRRRQKARIHRPSMEILEDRTMLDSGGLPAAIVVGRVLDTPSTADTDTPTPSYFAGDVQKNNNQVTITYTVYNEAADPESGVLLTTTLAPGVTMASASQTPDQSGQKLAWSMGTIQGYDRASVSITVNLPNASTLTLDTGASAYAMLDAGAVSATTPAATLQPGNVSDPSLLASTVDADTNDPFIQEEAAALNYSPTQIFAYMQTLGYNSYLGSVRGARGTLWSNAGNALDVASLGVALMRASGIPAQYVSGTLSQSQAQSLILSMFPASYQTVGYIPAGTQTSDPANDPQLLSETESHYWFQFNTGSGMNDADPLMPGATIGQTFTTSTGKFAAVPQSLEETTEVQLVAEIYSQASALFGLSSGLKDTTVLDQTFDDDYLVGRPLSVGNFVNQSGISAIFTEVTNTYTPYIDIGDDAYPIGSHDQVVTGTAYQEVLTSFPLASQILTGLFVNVTLGGSQAETQTYQHTIIDRIGAAARQGLATPNITINPSQAPAVDDFDITTLNILPSTFSVSALVAQKEYTEGLQSEFGALRAQYAQAAPGSDQTNLQDLSISDFRQLLIDTGRFFGDSFAVSSDTQTGLLATESQLVAYFDTPRIIITSTHVDTGNGTPGSATSLKLDISMDLLKNDIETVVAPGQATVASYGFNVARGTDDSVLESQLVPTSAEGQTAGLQIEPGVSAVTIFNAAQAAGIPIVVLRPADLAAVQSLNISEDARALITQSLQHGQIVAVPRQSVSIDGQQVVGWFETDATTGYTVGVLENGSHGLTDYTALTDLIAEADLPVKETVLFIAGVISTAGIGQVILALEVSVTYSPLLFFGVAALKATPDGRGNADCQLRKARWPKGSCL